MNRMELSEGIVGVYKPKGITSHDVINRIRKETGIRKIGHAGTLDPLASGVLVVGIGRNATKKLDDYVKKEKEYLATIRLGATSDTDDAEGGIEQRDFTNIPTSDDVRQALVNYVGTFDQQPPDYSSVKVAGRPAHRRKRAGEKLQLGPRRVTIHTIDFLDYRWPEIKIRAVTGPGVYIRALARDVGNDLKTGGYLSALERVRVGQFTKDAAYKLPD